VNPETNLVEIIELPSGGGSAVRLSSPSKSSGGKNHPFFVGTQFHPELKSRPMAPHPLFVAFIKAAMTRI